MDRYVLRFASKLFARLDTPRSLTCFILAKYGEWDQLVSLRCEPSSYEAVYHHDSDRFTRDYQATDLLRKCDGLPTSFDKARVARDSFYQCEAQCCDTNVRLSRHLDLPVLSTAVEWHADKLLRKARAWISAVLGPLPDRLDGRFGPGATFESKDWRLSQGLTAYDKLQFCPSVTYECSFLVRHLVDETAFGHSWGTGALDRAIPSVRGNRFTTVPKDATKDRGICIEPGVNLVGQLSLGGAIRHRLRRIGIDLLTGQDLHRKIARVGSLTNSIATIDLSNASDTVSRKLVELLLPEDWFSVLDALRSHFTQICHPGERPRWVQLQKFSSMGNGFTFELETLVFCSLAVACGGVAGVDTHVYGDDILVPCDISADVLALLRYCGFTPNAKKTFVDGPFRESCGGDFYAGADVRPLRLKSFPSDPAGWISLANKLYEFQDRTGINLSGCWLYVLERVPVEIRRCRGPVELGDLVVWDVPSNWCYRVRESVRYFRVWRPVVRRKQLYYVQRRDGVVNSKPSKKYRPSVHLSAALLGLPSEGLSPRGVAGYRFGRVALS